MFFVGLRRSHNLPRKGVCALFFAAVSDAIAPAPDRIPPFRFYFFPLPRRLSGPTAVCLVVSRSPFPLRPRVMVVAECQGECQSCHRGGFFGVYFGLFSHQNFKRKIWIRPIKLIFSGNREIFFSFGIARWRGCGVPLFSRQLVLSRLNGQTLLRHPHPIST